jgi:glycosyltransferase involved in cell wall biosynthesis
VQWFYDPMAVTAFAGHLDEAAIVYDCMDELSLFKGAPPELVRRERELLAIADVVFAGGPKMWKTKRAINRNCFCYGCGVDFEHFGRNRSQGLLCPSELISLNEPLFGYIGVVDERLDYGLIDALARSTKGHVVMVGPWTKIDPADLPRRENLHWLGGRDYAELPAYAAAFDVCLMPFALNDATRFINPTKALEYMATGRPLVSTAIEDVVAQFADIVAVAHNRSDFVAFCERAAVQPDTAAVERGLARARSNSWDAIVEKLEAHVLDVLRNQRLETDAA